MPSEENNIEMTIESLKLKTENQANLIKQLTTENEELYHQFNHLMIRNGKMLKRVDDLQGIISEMHVRIEELQLINGNMMNLNDSLRRRNYSTSSAEKESRDDLVQKSSSGLMNFNATEKSNSEFGNADQFNFEDLYNRWKHFPGQVAQNAPNLKKQVLMLIHLYRNKSLSANDLFRLCGLGGVTGARYVATLKKFGLIRYTGARKKGSYEITQNGKAFIDEHPKGIYASEKKTNKNIPEGIPVKPQVTIPNPTVLDKDDF